MPSTTPNLWICAFAVFQTTDKTLVSEQLGDDPRHAPFTRALLRAERFLVVRNRTTDIYTRIWCCWELYIAYIMGFLTSSKLSITGPNVFTNVKHDVLSAYASDPRDKEQILAAIEAEDGAREHINFIITLLDL